MRRNVLPVALALLWAGEGAAIQAAAPPAPQGVITAREFLDIGTGTAVGDLTNNAKFPDNPDIQAYPARFEWPTTADGSPPPNDVKNAYGVQIAGYIYPPTTADYVFYISADDNARLFLSTDDSPANKEMIAQEPTWNAPRDYNGITRRQLVDVGTQFERYNNVSRPIRLNAGQAYYIEAIMKEGGGGDNLSVAWTEGGFGFPTEPIDGAVLATIDKSSGPVSVSTQPANQTVTELQPVTFEVVANGTPPYTYQWLRNGQAIPDATGPSYTIAAAPIADNSVRFSVRITNAEGEVTSNEATLTVNPDTQGPTIVGARGNKDFSRLTIEFSEPVSQATATTVGNYSVNPSLTLSNPQLINPSTVQFNTSAQTQGTDYTVTVNNVQDTSVAGNTIAANSTTQFKAWLPSRGFLTAEFFRDIGGTAVQDLLSAQKFIDNEPDEVRFLTAFDTPNAYGDNYGVRVTGVLVPPETGNYYFFVRSDDASAFYINESGEEIPDPAVSFPVAEELDCCGAFMEPETGDFATTFAPIPLQEGRRYGVLFLAKDGSGGDFGQVAWRRDTDTTAAASLAPMAGNLFETLVDATGVTVTLAEQPQDTTVTEGRAATLTATAVATPADAVIAYQWFLNGQPIEGATRSSYTTADLALGDTGGRYKVVATTLGGINAESPEVTVTVVPDTFPPAILSAGAMRHGTDWEVGVIFDEPLASGATTVGNYSLSGGATISSARYLTNSSGLISKQSGVVLVTSALEAGQEYTVTVQGIADAKGNALGQAEASFTASKMSWTSIGTVDQFQPDAVAVGEDGFNLLSGGISFWNNTDDITFVYEEVSGDFDKVARVEYQDPSSQWARAGLHAREVLNANQPTAGAASRHQSVHLPAPTKFDGTPSNLLYETNRRLATDGPTDASGSGGGPNYPNSWLRLKREGQIFTMFRSEDGVNWVELGTSDFSTSADGPLPDQMFVGPVYGPENGNITPEDLRKQWAVRIRDYGDYTAQSPAATLSISLSGGNITISWNPAGGRLQSATAVTGPWTDVSGGANPATIPIESGEDRFFRVASP